MDIRLMGERATETDRRALDDVIGAAGVDQRVQIGGRATRAQRHLLLPALWALQSEVGWVSRGGLDEICRRLHLPPADAYAVASFYDLLSLEERPPRVVRVCDDLACRMAGAESVLGRLPGILGPEGEAWERSPCLGRCDRGSAAFVQEAGGGDHTVAPFDPTGLDSAPEPTPVLRRGPLTARVGVIDPSDLDAYRAAGGFEALRRTLRMGPAAVLREVKDSGLVGRGGAAFPTGVKWEAVASAPAQPHYLICNADESEPGTFKDRVLVEGDPYALIEAMTVAAFATGCHRGFVYLRGEYAEALASLGHAVETCRRRGLLGPDVMGSGFAFDVEIRRGAGAYICGEETALIASIEGYRGEPRTKPPFPTTHGLFGAPTLVNNVETLMNVLRIVTVGGPGFAAEGSGRSRGTKLFAVSGAVATPGVVEVEFGTTLGEVLAAAGGPSEPLRAVLVGGAAGAFLDVDALDTPLTFEGMAAAGAALGSGAVMAVGESVDIGDLVGRIARFFREESCGQCVPCREGTRRQEEALAAGRFDLVADLASVMTDASICGLGQTASSAVRSALALGLIGGGSG